MFDYTLIKYKKTVWLPATDWSCRVASTGILDNETRARGRPAEDCSSLNRNDNQIGELGLENSGAETERAREVKKGQVSIRTRHAPPFTVQGQRSQESNIIITTVIDRSLPQCVALHWFVKGTGRGRCANASDWPNFPNWEETTAGLQSKGHLLILSWLGSSEDDFDGNYSWRSLDFGAHPPPKKSLASIRDQNAFWDLNSLDFFPSTDTLIFVSFVKGYDNMRNSTAKVLRLKVIEVLVQL